MTFATILLPMNILMGLTVSQPADGAKTKRY